MVPSRLPLASVCPSGLNATESTATVPPLVRGWPNGLGCAGSATSHSPTVPSRLPLASVCPSGLNATEPTAAPPLVRGWPSGRGCAGSATSHSRDRAVVVAAGQRLPIRAERHRLDGAGAAGRGLAEQAGVRWIGDIPQPRPCRRALPLASVLPIGAERHRVRRRCRWSGLGRWAGRAGGGARDRRHPTAGSMPSSSPLASVCPSELNATESTAAAPLFEGLAERAGVRGIGDIPQPDRCRRRRRWPACARQG